MKHLYTVLKDNNSINLSIQVETFMKNGWKPQGGVSVSNFMYTSSGSPRHMESYRQAMIKDETK